MADASNAPVPETMEGLRRQNAAYRALCASLEASQAILTEKGRQYHEAVTTLESERVANAILTERVERLEEVLACEAVDLGLLRRAIEESDPKAELLIRVEDICRRANEATRLPHPQSGGARA